MSKNSYTFKHPPQSKSIPNTQKKVEKKLLRPLQSLLAVAVAVTVARAASGLGKGVPLNFTSSLWLLVVAIVALALRIVSTS